MGKIKAFAKIALFIIVVFSAVFLGLHFNTGSANNMTQFYPPNEDFKRAVEEVLKDKIGYYIHETLWKKTFHSILLFESLDGFTITTGATVNGARADLTTDGTLDNEVEVTKQPSWQGLITFSQKSFFRTNINFSAITNQIIYVTVGNKATTDNYGFKIVDNALYGVSYDSTTENTVLLQTIT